MRVAVDGRHFGKLSTGMSGYATSLICALAELRPDTEILLLHDRPAADGLPTVPGATWVRVSAPLYLWKQIGVPQALATRKAHVFHAPSGGVPLFSPCPLVATILDLLVEVGPEWFPPLVRLQVSFTTRLAAARADALIAISESTKRDLIRYYGVKPGKVTVIHCGVSEAFTPEVPQSEWSKLREKYRLSRPYVLYVGSLFRWRNLPRLVQAHRILLTRGVDVDLVLAGRDIWGNSDVPAEVARQGTEDRVHLLGYVPDEDLPALYASAAAFSYPSLHEGFGIPPLEAMASGVPVVVSTAASLPEVVGDAGLLVDPLAVKDLADGLQAVLTDEETRLRLRASGLERARHFSWRRAAEHTAAVYERCAGESAR